MGSKPPKTQTLESKTEPWAPTQPYLMDLMSQAQNLYRSDIGNQYAPFSTVVPYSPDTQAGLAYKRQVANNPALINSAVGQMQNTLAGDYLHPQTNPYLTGVTDLINNQITSEIAANAATPGRYNFGVHQDELNRRLGEYNNNLYSNNYEAERAAQFAAAAQAPQLYQAQMMPAELLQQTGQLREAQAQAQIQDQIARWNFVQQNPWDQLQRYNDIVNGNAQNWGSDFKPKEYGGDRGLSTAGVFDAVNGGVGLLDRFGAFDGGGVGGSALTAPNNSALNIGGGGSFYT